jgi:head-tail adaptor
MLEARWRYVLQGSVSTGAKEVESSTGRVWAAGFYDVTAHYRLAVVLKIMKHLFI